MKKKLSFLLAALVLAFGIAASAEPSLDGAPEPQCFPGHICK